jgi:hypothetical protein
MFAMTDSKRRLIGMGIPFALAFIVDTALTVNGNAPFELWDRLIFHRLALIDPLAVLAGYLLWAVVIVSLLLLLPEVLAVILTIAVVFGHVGGAYSQLTMHLGSWWYQAANGMFLLTAVTLGIGLWWSARASSMTKPSTDENRLPGWLRWWLIALFAALAGGILVVPWHA